MELQAHFKSFVSVLGETPNIKPWQQRQDGPLYTITNWNTQRSKRRPNHTKEPNKTKKTWIQKLRTGSKSQELDRSIKKQHTMPQSKETADKHNSHLSVCKGFGTPVNYTESHYLHMVKTSTMVNLPSSGRPIRMIPRAHQRLIYEVTIEPRTTSKQLEASQLSVKVIKVILFSTRKSWMIVSSHGFMPWSSSSDYKDTRKSTTEWKKIQGPSDCP